MWNIFLISTTVVIYTQFGEGQDDGFLRLMDGSHSREGRLEIFHRGIWGSVCLDDFGIKDGRVACRQLGFRCASDVQIYTESGHTSSTIWMAGVNCNGLESSLMQCSFRGWGRNNCISGHNVGIRCYGGCEGDLRLINGSYYGRLEIYHIGSWGTICDDSFGYEDALVVCKQLRLGTTIVQYYTAGHGSGTIWLDEVECNGNENRIKNCNHRGWNVHDCSHSEDIGVRCAGSLAVNGNWGSWSFWTTCNSNCGSGTRKRTRLCNNPLPAFGGSSCMGNSEDSHPCTGSSCPVRGNWGSWSAWTGCRSSCGSGYQTRHRVCNKPVPSSSGLYCNGRSFEVRNCNIAKCPVDGSWGHWSILSKCSVTCGRGSQQRTRNCDNPTPSFGGSSCTGVDKLTYSCSQIHCPVDGDWSEWVVWSLCSSSCGSGVKTRTRQCNDPSTTYGGVRCIGKNIDSNSCNIYECPVDGDWTKWSSWSTCTALCNGGIQERARTCSAPTPSNGGHYCKGAATESQPCNNAHCQINGQWGSWQEWNSCNITCGNGFQNRSRKCDNPFPMFGGSECVGFDFDIQNCSQDICPGAKRHGKEETSKLFSIWILGGVAAACIVVTVVIISIVLFVFRRFRCGQNGKRKKNGTNNNNGELRETTRTNNYECIGPSDGIQNDAYDIYNITRSGHTNSTFNADNEALYENLKI